MFSYLKRGQVSAVHLILSMPVHITNVNRLRRKKTPKARIGDKFRAAVR